MRNKVVIFVSNLAGGGAEKVMVTVANGLSSEGSKFTLLQSMQLE